MRTMLDRPDMSSMGLVTPTYGRDRELCALLCESVDRHVTSFSKHYLIVPDGDLALFAGFKSERRVVLPASSMLPPWLKPLPSFIRRGSRRYWWSRRSMPVSGWHVQQFIKIGAAATLPEDRYCLLDSDVVFFRQFDLSAFLRPQPLPLFHSPRAVTDDLPAHVSWVRSAHRLLGMTNPPLPADDFIGHIIFWDRAAVRAMIARIEEVAALEWMDALCRARDISEYMLYGYFARGNAAAAASHLPTTKKLCLSYWDAEALDRPALDRMLREAGEGYVAFSAASFSGTPVDLIRAALSDLGEPRRRVA